MCLFIDLRKFKSFSTRTSFSKYIYMLYYIPIFILKPFTSDKTLGIIKVPGSNSRQISPAFEIQVCEHVDWQGVIWLRLLLYPAQQSFAGHQLFGYTELFQWVSGVSRVVFGRILYNLDRENVVVLLVIEVSAMIYYSLGKKCELNQKIWLNSVVSQIFNK